MHSRRNYVRFAKKKVNEYGLGYLVRVYQQVEVHKKQLHKLFPKWIAPCKIVRRMLEHTWLVDMVSGKSQVIHTDLLKPFE